MRLLLYTNLLKGVEKSSLLFLLLVFSGTFILFTGVLEGLLFFPGVLGGLLFFFTGVLGDTCL